MAQNFQHQGYKLSQKVLLAKNQTAFSDFHQTFYKIFHAKSQIRSTVFANRFLRGFYPSLYQKTADKNWRVSKDYQPI